jgi:hypothetical protein
LRVGVASAQTETSGRNGAYLATHLATLFPLTRTMRLYVCPRAAFELRL